jgi:hypothetical protein
MVPFAPTVLGTRAVFTAPYGELCIVRRSVVRSPCQARLPRSVRALLGSRPTPQRSRSRAPAAAPAYKGHAQTGRARPRHAGVLPFPSTTPSSSAFGRGPAPP